MKTVPSTTHNSSWVVVQRYSPSLSEWQEVTCEHMQQPVNRTVNKILISPRSLKDTQPLPISAPFTNPEGHNQSLPWTSYFKQLFCSQRQHERGREHPGSFWSKALYIESGRNVRVLCALTKLAWTKHIPSERGEGPELFWPTLRLIFYTD